MLHPTHPKGLCADFGCQLIHRASKGMPYTVYGEYRNSGEWRGLLQIREACWVRIVCRGLDCIGLYAGVPLLWAQRMLMCKKQNITTANIEHRNYKRLCGEYTGYAQ